MKERQSRKQSPATNKAVFDRVRKLALDLPEVEEGPSYGTPGFRVAGKLFARLHQDGESLVIRIEEPDRRLRMETDPAVFYITDHYRDYPWMLVRLAHVHDDDLKDLLMEAWKLMAPSRLLDGEGRDKRT
jgi:hypothetical protein